MAITWHYYKDFTDLGNISTQWMSETLPSGCPKPHSARIVVGPARQVKVRKRKMARAKAQVPIRTQNMGGRSGKASIYIYIYI